MTMIYLGLFIGGVAILFFAGLRPTLKLLSSTGWPKTTCQIVASHLETRTSTGSLPGDSKVKTAKPYEVPVIVYSYIFNGNEYQSNCYNFWKTAASDADRAVIQNHPRGAQGFCLVNPSNPAEAVFHPMIPLGMSFLLFWGIGMVVAGGSGLLYDLRSYLLARGGWPLKRRNQRTAVTTRQSNQIVLQSKRGNRKGFFYALSIATFICNGFCVLLLLIFFRQLGSHSSDFLSVILPVLVGALLTVVTIRKYLSFLDPQPILTIPASAVRIEEPFDLEWRFSGRAKQVTDLQVFLESYEVERQPKSQIEENKSSFKPKDHPQSSLQVVSGWSNRQGKTTVTIPSGGKPTMQDTDREIFWQFRVIWGTYKKSVNQRKFTLTVLPHSEPSPVVSKWGIGN